MLGVLLSRRWLPITLLVLAASAVCARLGVWQLDRLAQRRASNARVSYITSLPAAVLPSTEDLGRQEHRAVRVQGVYDFGHQVALRNQARGGEYGYHLLTPLAMRDTGTGAADGTILVDRGWIPAAGNQNPDDWRKYDAPGTVDLSGVIRLGRVAAVSAVGNSVSAAADPAADKFVLTVDPAQISSQVGYPLPSFYVQAAGSEDSGTLPATEVPHLDLTNGPHLGYALQWFSFAVALPVGFFFYVRRQEAGGT
jgi:surfeit locus 1 family protein